MSEAIREVAFDTETTGLEPENGDRIVEVGAVELINHIPTGKNLRILINPARAVSEATVRVTGITDDMLVDKPFFEDPSVVDRLVEFIGPSKIVAHNAKFDRGFLNMELRRCGRQPYEEELWVDTLAIARKRFPGSPASLDALCRRFNVSLESRTLHGALLDAQLLATVYLELLGGRARAFEFDGARSGEGASEHCGPARQREKPLPTRLTHAESERHAEFVDTLGNEPIWRQKVG
ncbi:MAG: DNA polymerase III subunit epsilon [Pseudomonadota bacterium]